MLSFFIINLVNNFVIFLNYFAQKSKKFQEMDKNKCPKTDMAKPFCAKTRGTR
jgi:hypothetical protein